MKTESDAKKKGEPPAKPEASEKPQQGQQEQKQQPPNRKPLIILGIVVIIAAVIGFIHHLHARHFETTDDAFVEGHVVQVSARVAAPVLEVKFDDNSEVKKGDLLLVLDPRDSEAALEKAKAQMAQAEAQIAQAEASVEQANSQLAQAEAQATQQGAQFGVAAINFGRNSSLFQKDIRAVSQQDLDTAKSTQDSAKGALDAARANVESIRSAGSSAAAQVVAAKANVEAAQAAVHSAELQLSYTKVYAAEDGRIARKQVEPGNYIQPGQTMCSLVSNDVWVVANFKETQLREMVAGQSVDLEIDAFPKRKLRGHVDSFQSGTGARFSLLPPENATGNYVKVVQRIPVKIVFDESPDQLKRLGPGQSVIPTVDLRTGPNRDDHH